MTTIKREKFHSTMYITGLIMMAVALPFSYFLMSLSQFFLIGNWLLEGKFKLKLSNLKRNKAALFTIGIFALYLIGLLWTDNLKEGLNQIRIVLPVLVFALVAGSGFEINKSKRKWILTAFVASVFAATAYSFYLSLTNDMIKLGDLRNLSPFVSHIRFSLMICMAIVLVFEQLYYNRKTTHRVAVSILLIAWFTVFLFIVQSLTGLILLTLLLLIFTLFIIIPRLKRVFQIALFLVVISFGSLGVFFLFQDYKNYANAPIIDTEMLPFATSYGNPYMHDLNNLQIENGNYIWLFICETELRKTWNQRSAIDFDSFDKKGHPVKATLIRYLNSLGYSKDRDGTMKLSDDDIRMIEAGHANYVYTRLGDYRQRLYQIYFEFDNARNYTAVPDGQSIWLRSELWRTAWHVFKKYPLLGSGTGDLKDDFIRAYQERETSLNEKWWYISHNQYLTMLSSFGIIGFVLFVFFFFTPWLLAWKSLPLASKGFFIILSFSMFSEDTLTSQAGVSFFVFFLSMMLLLFHQRQAKSEA